MKKTNLITGFLALALIATLSISQTASALSFSQIFGFGKSDDNQQESQQNNQEDGHVLSASTDDTDQQPIPENPKVPAEVMVEVQKGDSLSKIAKAQSTTYKRLFDANTFISDPNVINPGDKIRIPDADEQIASREIPISAPRPVASPKTTKKFNNQRSNSSKQSNQVVSTAPAVADGSVWDKLAKCESGGNWSINTGNGYYGGLQFTASTWRAVGGTGLPHQNSREEQIKRAEILLARSGWGQWPACTKKLGLR